MPGCSTAAGARYARFTHERARSTANLRASRVVQPQSAAAAHLFDDLIRTREECWGNGQSQFSGNFQVDGQMKTARLLDGEIGWLRTLQYLVNITSGADVKIGIDHVICHQAAAIDHLNRKWVHTRQPVPGGELTDLDAQRHEQALTRDDERLRSVLDPRLECRVKI